MKVLITGSAGFIGNRVAQRLLERGDEVVGIDNLSPYYDVKLKEARLAQVIDHPGYTEARFDMADRERVAKLFAEHKPDGVVNLAAQAGVRHSLIAPHDYVDTNLVGFTNILEGCRHNGVKHLVFASSSSVYGTNSQMPFSVHDKVDHPISLYAASKRANELMAHTYAHLFGFAATGLRFFTVYGPWGRPDMALFLFTKAILAGEPIDVFNHGQMKRSFTYIDDIVEGVIRVLDNPPQGPTAKEGDNDPASSHTAPFRVFNIGSDTAVSLMRYIEVLEENLGIEAKKNMLPMQPGDVAATWAEVNDLREAVGYEPTTSVEDGVRNFVNWYRDFYGV
ncbi:MAG: NAD-dependent epimerase [Alphaproteobacteria bacterium]|nr:NAD-dependent epimerase [Alphaproteobacteria bacterium]MBF0250365.1 NAD-dependent epimerase [Alphaproteobacteria bacterium]